MKKNIAMRVAAFLFILTMISTCAFATTFAKYTTSATHNETVRVAKWGIDITAVAGDGVEYDTKESGADAEIKVASDTALAPGSYVNLFGFKITGTPEVASTVSYEATLVLSGWEDENGDPYCPVVIKVQTTTTTEFVFRDTAHSTESIEQFITRVEGAIESFTETYEAGVAVGSNLTVTYIWAFNGNDDVNDTYLGNEAAEGRAATIKLDITCRVSQVD